MCRSFKTVSVCIIRIIEKLEIFYSSGVRLIVLNAHAQQLVDRYP